ncbi:MAG: potassium transporter TrkH, partial [Pseudomonadota bacterium]|nr:potassium transporter TrkH [Pseudomonadota bacterium]
MNEFRTVLFIIGLMLGSLAVGMLVPAVTGLFQTSPDWQSFIISACFTGFFAVALILTSRGE